MSSPHEEKYKFAEPRSIREAKERMLALHKDMMNIEKQLTDTNKRKNTYGADMTPKEYRYWYSKIRASHIYKITEYKFLKEWVKHRRRALAAERIDVDDPDDARQLLIAARNVLRKVLDGEHDDPVVGDVYSVIDKHLIHVA